MFSGGIKSKHREELPFLINFDHIKFNIHHINQLRANVVIIELNMFEVNNKDPTKKSCDIVLVSLFATLNV